jgi:hypothetical protein
MKSADALQGQEGTYGIPYRQSGVGKRGRAGIRHCGNLESPLYAQREHEADQFHCFVPQFVTIRHLITVVGIHFPHSCWSLDGSHGAPHAFHKRRTSFLRRFYTPVKADARTGLMRRAPKGSATQSAVTDAAPRMMADGCCAL